eukprot:gb/GECH01012976.1/.p1 GENE.gb/GECH01012976.1/~~gb/GECH01012976.1/.p1  ORF type:complete len:661 (+),score=191.77 gb/GECH01012976.1/:1-1983(+)
MEPSWKEKRQAKKQDRKNKKQEELKSLSESEIQRRIECAKRIKQEGKKRKQEQKERLTQVYNSNNDNVIGIIVDCSFEEKMKYKELKSLGQQLMFSYGLNKSSTNPVKLGFSSLNHTPTVKQSLEKISGFKNWHINIYDEHFTQYYQSKDLIYLTADSPNSLETLELGKTYIIGGIVDRNRYKNICQEEADKYNIPTAKLPIAKLLSDLSASQVLTVNQCLQILLRYNEGKTWAEAVEDACPRRKRNREEEQEEQEEAESKKSSTNRNMLYSGNGEPIMEIHLPYSNFKLSITVDRNSERIRKPFLGGFRNTKTNTEYHHASCQTNPKKRNLTEREKKQKYHRETQTVDKSTNSQQTNREQGTQMARSDLIISERDDRIIIPSGNYFDAEQVLQVKTEKSIKIQSWIRGCFARNRARQMFQQLKEKNDRQKEAQEKREKAKKAKKEQEILRKTHPRSKADFDNLLEEVENWRKQETRAIKESNLSREEKQIEMKELLNRETKLFQIIERLRQNASKENKNDSVTNMLEKMSSSRTFQNFEGGNTAVETDSVKRAKELKQLYEQLTAKPKNVDQRLDTLLHVKFTVKEFDCELTRDIIELIDREGDLLHRGRRQTRLLGLRQRLNNLFLEFIQTPEFNPEANNHISIPLEYANRKHVKLLQ